ncbi:pyridoxamine 5'-phosphate oxidase family protein [Microgenomates group bacterium]|nr:pyridoxamine 5'-phosphate oxidase family protein [Microgenomates group bacterium]
MELKDKDALLKYLKSQNLMSLATCGPDMWISTVYYVVDEKFNLYFISEATANHCQAFKKNVEVSCAIADSRQPVTAKKIGVQIRGKASQVNSLQKMKWMLAMWNKVNPGFEAIINLKNIQKRVIKSKVYKIQPQAIKFFNEELYGEEGFLMFKF